MCRLTIFTPVYNRVFFLERLYKSLQKQTCLNFNWMIIDDGSTDSIKEYVNSLILTEKKFTISYFRKENGGMYTAYNLALSLIDTDYWVCIDSDDWMPEDSIEKIYRAIPECENAGAAGIVGLDSLEDGTILGGLFPEEAFPVSHLIDIQLKIKHAGDMKMVYRKTFSDLVGPMPEFKGEKDFNPYYMMLQIDEHAPLYLLNDVLCIVEYQADGMTNSVWQAYKRSPISYGLLRLEFLKRKNLPLVFAWRQSVHYVSSWLFTISDSEKKGKLPAPIHRPLMFLSWIPGLLLNIVIRFRNRYKLFNIIG